jgi:tetratricopeptide (TPR) repeat protein
VTRLQPANAAAWNSRCWTRAVIGQLQPALADCNEALRLRPDFANALDSRGFVHLKAGRYDDAIADYDAALRIDPKKVASLYGRGMAKRRKQDLTGGNLDIAAARAMKPSVSMDFARYGLSPPLSDTPAQAHQPAGLEQPLARR